MIAQAGESTVLVDASKFGVRALSVIASISEVSRVVTYGLTEVQTGTLRSAGAAVSDIPADR